MIFTSDGWVTINMFWFNNEGDINEIAPMNILRTEIIGIGKSAYKNKACIVIRGGNSFTIDEEYEDATIDFFFKQKKEE